MGGSRQIVLLAKPISTMIKKAKRKKLVSCCYVRNDLNSYFFKFLENKTEQHADV